MRRPNRGWGRVAPRPQNGFWRPPGPRNRVFRPRCPDGEEPSCPHDHPGWKVLAAAVEGAAPIIAGYLIARLDAALFPEDEETNEEEE